MLPLHQAVLSFCRLYTHHLLNSEQEAQVCDATKADSSTAADYLINFVI